LDPFEKVWPLVEQWLNEQPDTRPKDLSTGYRQSCQSHFNPVNGEPFSVE
jgi:hypothetical protein